MPRDALRRARPLPPALDVLADDIGELDEMEAGVTCLLLRGTAQGQGVCLTPGTLGTSSRAACCPLCRGGPFVRPFMACPTTS